MIQRIQSLYLTIIIILSLLLLNGGILNFTDGSGNSLKLSSAGILTDQNQKIVSQVFAAWPLTSLQVLIILISLVAVLMFRNRKKQMFLTRLLIVLSAVLIAAISWFGFKTYHDLKMILHPGIKMALPVLILLFSILAFRGIHKDDQLVKSYDRLR
jgi:glucan phosphoethanolaminetransferase (alkaline phosphatase superfamily)